MATFHYRVITCVGGIVALSRAIPLSLTAIPTSILRLTEAGFPEAADRKRLLTGILKVINPNIAPRVDTPRIAF
jgi:hypothetical protein